MDLAVGWVGGHWHQFCAHYSSNCILFNKSHRWEVGF